MSDKISYETLLLIANDQLDACSLIDVSAGMARELLSRRAAEAKPAVLQGGRLKSDGRFWYSEDDVKKIIKAAGGTVKE